jgi:WbqC-like protein family
VAIHQPNYIPWLGYFFKIAHSDKFVFLDIVTYSCGSFVNRNSIKTPNGPAWLTIPVLKSGRFGQLIGEAESSNIQPWAGRHLATLQSNYGRAPYFRETLALLEPHYCAATDKKKSLSAFNIEVICSIANHLRINTQFICASDLNVSGHKTELLLDICRVVGATAYLAGTGGKCYQENEKFEHAGITPLLSSFSQQSYPQLFGEFVGNLSIVDVLMNCGYLGTRRLLGIESEHHDGAIFDDAKA